MDMDMNKIRFLVMDADGTLTDGKIYIGESGELFKVFDIKDGAGIHDILPQYGIVPVVITARKSCILENRCRELGIKELYQNAGNKLVCLECLIHGWSERDGVLYGLSDVAYIGDDLLDLQCMTAVKKKGGTAGCPADAVEQVKEVSDFIAAKNGGDGAVREFIEWIIDRLK